MGNKVYSVENVLTKGVIVEHELKEGDKVCLPSDATSFLNRETTFDDPNAESVYGNFGRYMKTVWYFGKDIFRTREDAIARGKILIERKIASHEKSLKKLRDIDLK